MGIPAQLTPMLAQYLEMKRQYADAILFYRMGDFYEMFFEDAVKAAPVLEVQLTSRDKNAQNPVPMCGVPHHSAVSYIQKLLSHGFKVALCEQLEDPANAKGIVKRDVVRVLTPALVGDPEMVSADQKVYLLALHESDGSLGLCLLNLLDSQLRVGFASSVAVVREILHEYQPREVLVDDKTADTLWFAGICKSSSQPLVTRRSAYFPVGLEACQSAHAAMVSYLRETQKMDLLSTFGEVLPLFTDHFLAMDSVTLSALEIVRPLQEGGKSLAEAIDKTVTPMGRRLLRDWLSRPSHDLREINGRLDAVEYFIHHADFAEQVRALLTPLRDLERLSTKTALGLAMPRDLVAIRGALAQLPTICSCLQEAACPPLRAIASEINPLPDLRAYLDSAMEDEQPGTYREGGIFRATFHPDIAEYRGLSREAKSTIAGIETRERERTGIASLKVKFNRVFGYTIEITNSYLSRVPQDYIRKQTISTGERFVTEELKAFEEKAISAEHRLKTLEETLFLEARQKVGALAPTLSANARCLAKLDVLQGFASHSRQRGYCRAQFNADGILDIRQGRHPVVELLLEVGTFVSNSVRLAPGDCRTMILTGPNMGGKSTILRQIALVSVLAQSGSFVPASGALLPLLDAVYTRIGSSDDLSRGRSTFMVEMTEVARILKCATPRSLILIDEIGRGTSTYDGLALAWSLLEHLHNKVQGLTLFATHFHEVTALENSLPGIQNANVLVEKWKDEVVFLYKLAPGVCNRSYGIEVAKLAGLPPEVLSRATHIQGLLESQSQRAHRARGGALSSHDKQMGFFDGGDRSEMLSPLET